MLFVFFLFCMCCHTLLTNKVEYTLIKYFLCHFIWRIKSPVRYVSTSLDVSCVVSNVYSVGVICRPTIAGASAARPWRRRQTRVSAQRHFIRRRRGQRGPICVHLRLMRVAVRCCGLKWHPLVVWPRPSSMEADVRRTDAA